MVECVECEKRGCPTEGMTKVCVDGKVRCLAHVHLTPGFYADAASAMRGDYPENAN